MRYKRYLIAFLAVFVAVGLSSGQAGANPGTNLNIDEMAALVVLPIITGGDPGNPLKPLMRGDVVIPVQTAATLSTITNGSSDSVILKVDLISGDVVPAGRPSDACQTQSFICPLTGRETTTFVFTPWGNNQSRLDVECSGIDPDGLINEDNPTWYSRVVNGQNGFMVVSVGDPLSLGFPTVGADVLFADAVVVDQQQGQAYSFGAISFQADKGANDGTKIYQFDGLEYAKFPSAVAANFLAPGVRSGGNSVQAELILFTLDFATGSIPIPLMAVAGYTYNDDEEWCDWDYEFECFDIAALEDIDDCHSWYPPPSNMGLGSISGHLEMFAQSIGLGAGESHDVNFGNSDGARKRPVHGWIVQNVVAPPQAVGVILAGNQPIPLTPPVISLGTAAWGRPLAQSSTALVKNAGDMDPVLDASVAGP